MISVKKWINTPVLLMFLIVNSCTQQQSGKGDRLYSQGEYEEAIDAYTTFLSNNPKNLNALYNRGRSHEELGNFEAAERDFLTAHEQDPKNVQVLLSLSNVYQKQKKHTQALLYAEYAVEVPGAPAMAYFLKARALHQIGNVQEAMVEYTAAISQDKNFGQAFYYRGMLNYATEKKSAACEDFQNASKLNFEPAQDALANYCQ